MSGGDDTLLAVVDMQAIFADGPWGAPRFAEIVEPIVRLHEAFAGRSVFTRFVVPERFDGAWRDYYAQSQFAQQPPDAPDYQLVEPFGRLAEGTLDAPTFGKWRGGLDALVPRDGRLVLAGVSTDCCVLSTVLPAVDAGVRVQVVADACAGADDESHDRALRAMALYVPFVEIVTVADVLAGR